LEINENRFHPAGVSLPQVGARPRKSRVPPNHGKRGGKFSAMQQRGRKKILSQEGEKIERYFFLASSTCA